MNDLSEDLTSKEALKIVGLTVLMLICTKFLSMIVG